MTLIFHTQTQKIHTQTNTQSQRHILRHGHTSTSKSSSITVRGAPVPALIPDSSVMIISLGGGSLLLLGVAKPAPSNTSDTVPRPNASVHRASVTADDVMGGDVVGDDATGGEEMGGDVVGGEEMW